MHDVFNIFYRWWIRWAYFILGKEYEKDEFHKSSLLYKEYYKKAANLGHWDANQKLKQHQDKN